MVSTVKFCKFVNSPFKISSNIYNKFITLVPAFKGWTSSSSFSNPPLLQNLYFAPRCSHKKNFAHFFFAGDWGNENLNDFFVIYG